MTARPPTGLKVSARERMICALVADGLTDAQIASRMRYATRSAEDAVKRLRYKVGATNRAHLVLIAVRAGWIE